MLLFFTAQNLYKYIIPAAKTLQPKPYAIISISDLRIFMIVASKVKGVRMNDCVQLGARPN